MSGACKRCGTPYPGADADWTTGRTQQDWLEAHPLVGSCDRPKTSTSRRHRRASAESDTRCRWGFVNDCACEGRCHRFDSPVPPPVPVDSPVAVRLDADGNPWPPGSTLPVDFPD